MLPLTVDSHRETVTSYIKKVTRFNGTEYLPEKKLKIIPMSEVFKQFPELANKLALENKSDEMAKIISHAIGKPIMLSRSPYFYITVLTPENFMFAFNLLSLKKEYLSGVPITLPKRCPAIALNQDNGFNEADMNYFFAIDQVGAEWKLW